MSKSMETNCAAKNIFLSLRVRVWPMHCIETMPCCGAVLKEISIFCWWSPNFGLQLYTGTNFPSIVFRFLQNVCLVKEVLGDLGIFYLINVAVFVFAVQAHSCIKFLTHEFCLLSTGWHRLQSNPNCDTFSVKQNRVLLSVLSFTCTLLVYIMAICIPLTGLNMCVALIMVSIF